MLQYSFIEKPVYIAFPTYIDFYSFLLNKLQ